MNEPKKPLILTAEERRSSLWLKLMAHWLERLESTRKQNESDLPEVQTAKLRGRIAELNACIGLNEENPTLISAARGNPHGNR